ncbi:acetyltransferase (GNAT) family protein [Pantoea allii]|uniref:PanD regulatory factor n=2 Tax=Pantoea allii TaxID=574096 RepID=A0A2V2BJ85_9GAMM|nr:acetyltransferase (GNAT) family protein [Pantoea allii]
MLCLKSEYLFITIILALGRGFDLFYCLKCVGVPVTGIDYIIGFLHIQVFVMKLTIMRLTALTQQDRTDLGKIWPERDIAQLEASLNESHRLYAARFNDRLLAALQLEISGIHGKVHHLTVREATKRRGVGQYLLEETMQQNPSLNDWWIADDGSDDQRIRAAFMQACGFRAQVDGWVK